MGFNGFGDTLYGLNCNSVSKYPVRCFNKEILVDIVAKSFKSHPSDEYIPFLLQNDGIVYFETEGKGLAVVIPYPAKDVLPHVKTMAVLPKHQHNHVGSDLRYIVSQEFPRFNLRSRQDRDDANAIYRKWFGRPTKFVNIDGTHYNAYSQGHLRKEKKLALEWMVQQPDVFKDKNFINSPYLLQSHNGT